MKFAARYAAYIGLIPSPEIVPTQSVDFGIGARGLFRPWPSLAPLMIDDWLHASSIPSGKHTRSSAKHAAIKHE